MLKSTPLQFFCVFTLLVGLAGPAAGQVHVDFPDPNLEAAIRDAIGKPTGAIYDTDVAGLWSLYAQDAAISDLTGLEYCTNLAGLGLGRNQISDLRALAGLNNLVSLGLGDNQINDLGPLAGLTSLSVLYLGRNQISDLSALAGLSNLAELDLGMNQINDLRPLAGLTSLTTLGLGDNQINDLGPLAGLTSLSVLYLGGNQISDLGPLAGLTSLSVLYLRINQISDLGPLEDLTNLTRLGLAANQISDLGPLAGLTNLAYLDLAANEISDIRALVANAGMGSEDEIDLRWNPLNEDSICEHIPALEARGATIDWDPPDGIECVERREQTAAQQKCIRSLNGASVNLGTAQGTASFKCGKFAASGATKKLGIPPTAQACLTSEVHVKVQRKIESLATQDAKRCRADPQQLPDFGYAGTMGAGTAVLTESLGVTEDLFGPDLDAALVSKSEDKAGAKCQAVVHQLSHKVFTAVTKEVQKSVDSALKGKALPPADSRSALSSAVESAIEADAKNRIAKAEAKLANKASITCQGDLASLFPGRCSGGQLRTAWDLAYCANEAARCRGCKAAEGFADLTLSCDEFDNGVVDASCQ